MAEVPRRIEQSGLPTALLWHPLLGSDFEDRLVRPGLSGLCSRLRHRAKAEVSERSQPE